MPFALIDSQFVPLRKKRMFYRALIFILFASLIVTGQKTHAEIPANSARQEQTLSLADRMALARQFVQTIGDRLKHAPKTGVDDINDGVTLPDGEELLFQISLERQLALDTPVLGRTQGGDILLSLTDLVGALRFAINIDAEQGIAQGWYVRENKGFSLDMAKRAVTTDQGTFLISENVVQEHGDIMVPLAELRQWFGFGFKPNVGSLNISLESPIKLPVQEELERKGRLFANNKIGPAVLPRAPEDRKALDMPFVDVSTFSSYDRPGDGGENTQRHTASVRTAGDLAYGTLTTQSQFEKEEKLTNLRATYKQESLEPELLGPLKARKFEVGDVVPVPLPLQERSSYGVGARVTNVDPNRNFSNSSTEITGTAFPGWDVELYRGAQLLSYQKVADNGVYRFTNVDLFSSDNNFRVVFYGPQGETREEEIYIPVDPLRRAKGGSIYDVTIAAQDTQTYRKLDFDSEDKGAPAITALYEAPVGEKSAVSAALTTNQEDGEFKTTAHTGLSTTIGETLMNFNAAVDNKGEMAGEVVARRDFDQHQLRNETRIATEEFGRGRQNISGIANGFGQSTTSGREVFGNTFSMNGPMGINIGTNTRYNLDIDYSHDATGGNTVASGAGFSTLLSPFSISQNFLHTHSDFLPDDEISSLTSITGGFGKNRLRLTADYNIAPEARLDRVSANLRRYITPKAEGELDLQHYTDPKLTEGSVRLNWDAGFANISPGVTYNSDNDVVATLNTRFGLARNPATGSIKMFDRAISTYGGVSAFVYLDKNGDSIFNEGDEPIEGATISAPQNGGRQTTDENGYAIFHNMSQLRLTDVFVDSSNLPDPYWVAGCKGVSVVPREGHVYALEFPVHMSGEVDGMVYARDNAGNSSAVRGVNVGLYDKAGNKIMGTVTETDGFYLFSRIPPGSYYLTVDDSMNQRGKSRPLPQEVHIGYEGTIVYANNIYLEEGKADVPLTILANAPEENKEGGKFEGRKLALNLGQYKSRVAMGLAWFKIRSLNSDVLSDVDLIQRPSESFPDKSTGEYILRASVRGNDLEHAYRTCGTIVKNGNSCSVEILPGGLESQHVASAD